MISQQPYRCSDMPLPSRQGLFASTAQEVNGLALRPDKVDEVSELKERLGRAQVLVLADYRGLDVAQTTKLRRKLREAGVEFRVTKNTLLRIAAREQGVEGLDPYLEGPTAIAFGFEDPAVPAKILSDYIKAEKDTPLTLKAGWLQGKVLDLAGIKALADLPAKEVLLAQLIGALEAPMVQLAQAINAPAQNLAMTLNALAEKQGAQASA